MADAMKTTLVDVHAMILPNRARSAGHDFVRPLPAFTSDNCEHCHFNLGCVAGEKVDPRWHEIPKER